MPERGQLEPDRARLRLVPQAGRDVAVEGPGRDADRLRVLAEVLGDPSPRLVKALSRPSLVQAVVEIDRLPEVLERDLGDL